ncbi:hypothetical protein BJ170DRAFT_694577 [Xylariales sp. AK1849]|nr:hypothetical protein BJ170DRAFT_694577 [Xylariales sp. AK1849]
MSTPPFDIADHNIVLPSGCVFPADTEFFPILPPSGPLIHNADLGCQCVDDDVNFILFYSAIWAMARLGLVVRVRRSRQVRRIRQVRKIMGVRRVRDSPLERVGSRSVINRLHERHLEIR